MLYLLKQLSFSKIFFHVCFYLVTLLQFVTPLLEIQFCCQSCDLIFPPKTVNIERQNIRLFVIKNSTILETLISNE